MLLAIAAPLPAVDMLYVTLGNNTIVTYDTTGNIGSTIAASMATFASTNLSNPQGLAFDSTGNLYAANFGDSTISKFNSSGAYVSNITTTLRFPFGLAIDTSGNLYAANSDDSTISKFNSSGAYLSNITTNLSTPLGLAFDSSGNLYAANNGNNTISKFNSSGAYVSSGSIGSTNLSGPYGLAFDSTGNLYAANNGNSTISKFNSSGTFLTSWSTGATPRFLAFKPVTVPEPSTYALAAIATGVMAYLARRRKARTA
jgi:sugar lactone lactonase YvrE